MWYNSITNQASNRLHQTHTSRQRGVCQRGETLSQIHFFFVLIGALASQQTPSNGAKRPLGHTGRLGALLGGWPSCGARPHPNNALTQSSGLSAGWGGDWGQTPWAHPLVLHASRHPALFLLLFFTHVIGWSGDVLILDSYQESPREFSSATHPWGMNPISDWHPASASRP